MSGQEEFKDYNYEGSRLAKLIDLLAYNTMYIQQF
jgi:baseplate structural protein gp6|uniref:Baseplate wedge subunit n=1 Tax=Myoviridae sp. ctCo31 TaxID=2825053 RepID=A0A8S5ULU2_9CAUD|nr:MAG TPA: baseplate wedge subunit [Myoviridae sp. ctCo31]